MPSRRCEGRTASSTRCARSSPNSMMAKPLIAPRAAEDPLPVPLPLPLSHATTASVSRSRIARITLAASYFQPRPASMKSRDIIAMACASRGSAIRTVMARGVMRCIVPCITRRGPFPLCPEETRVCSAKIRKGECMDSATRVETAGLETAASLADDIKNRSPDAAAEKLVDFGPSEIATALMQVAPGFAQDVLAALPDVTRELVFAAAPDEVAAQWQRNALYDRDAIGRMMEPVIGAFPPERKVGETIEELREKVKTALVTYIWV